jgi:hypothetical protein
MRSPPRNELDLLIAAKNGWCVGLDNLSNLPVWLSDALCRLSTGGGLGTRQYYTNDEEVIFDVMRPLIINGINELATRADLLDRSSPITLPVIREEKRRAVSELRDAFRVSQPGILGGLLDAMSGAMKYLPTVDLVQLPRMADFAKRAAAAEKALSWPKGSFMAAYLGNRAGANEMITGRERNSLS